jgi:hypothetical protein
MQGSVPTHSQARLDELQVGRLLRDAQLVPDRRDGRLVHLAPGLVDPAVGAGVEEYVVYERTAESSPVIDVR